MVGYIFPQNKGRLNDETLLLEKGVSFLHVRSSRLSISDVEINYYKGAVLKGTYILEPGESRDYSVNNSSSQKYDVIEIIVPADSFVDYDYLR